MLQARGRTLLNLRVTDAESGLLGRTLLTLVPNKGFGSTPAVPLHAHKFSPHDVVALKASNAGLGAPPLCTGLVYRSVTAAVYARLRRFPAALVGAMQVSLQAWTAAGFHRR